MGVTRKLINWCDTKLNEAYSEEDSRKGSVKASVSGFVEGFMDAAIIMYIPVVIGCLINQAKNDKK